MIRTSVSRCWKDDDAATVEFFARQVAEHGVGPRALDWGSAQSQALRFARLAAIGDLRGASLLDVGCGQGDLKAWLHDRGIDVRYTGVDLTPAMIDACRRRFPDETFEVAAANDLANVAPGAWDFVFACGIFYRRTVEPFEFLQATVAHLFERCRRGTAFNSLSAWGADQDAGEFYADPAAVLDFCRRLTPRVALDHAYHGRDFTVHLYK